MKLYHIVKYFNVIFKFDNGLYRPCLQELWPFVYEKSPFQTMLHSKSNSFDQILMKLGHIVYYHNVFFKFDNGLIHIMLS